MAPAGSAERRATVPIGPCLRAVVEGLRGGHETVANVSGGSFPLRPPLDRLWGMDREAGRPRPRRPARIGLAACLLGLAAPAPGPAGAGPAEAEPDSTASGVVISAVFADGYAPGDADEAIQLWNVGPAPRSLAGWALDDGRGRAAFGPGARLEPGAWIWLTREPEAFTRSFGRPPDAAWGRADGFDGLRMATLGGGPRLADGGERLELRDAGGELVDALVYGDASADPAPGPGWSGAPLHAYAGGVIGSAHQVLSRKLDPSSGQPTTDHDRGADWASDVEDPLLGRRARYPGWDLEALLRPLRLRETARIEIALAPDALRGFLLAQLRAARRSIDMAVYSFENPELAEALAERAAAGLRVRLLVEGGPVGGIDLAERWCLDRIAAAGGQVWWMDAGGDVAARYRGMHAKLALIDERRVLVGSENPNLGSTPAAALATGSAGRRGVYAAIEAPGAAAWARDLLARDIDPSAHRDLRPFQPRDPTRGAPPADFVPDREGGGAGYAPIAPEPLRLTQSLTMEWLSAPESALDPISGPAGLVARAGPGDSVLVEQLAEPLWWGDGPVEGNPALNPRVQAYLVAARRGARVRVLLDGYFDDPASWNGNAVTVQHLNERGRSEGLDLQARLGNPTGQGLHNKMILLTSGCGDPPVPGGREPPGCGRWSQLGSLNGSEVASKVNREVAVNLRSDAIYAYLAEVFAWDWARSGANALYLPRLSWPPRDPPPLRATGAGPGRVPGPAPAAKRRLGARADIGPPLLYR